MLGISMRYRRGIWKRTAIALLAGFTLVSCEPAPRLSNEEVAQHQQFSRPYQVERTVHTHLVPVSATNTVIGEQQYRDLYSFLIGTGARPGDLVVLASRRARLDHRNQVQNFLRRVGVRPVVKLIKDPLAGAEDDGYGEAILVQFDLYLTQQHVCGKWGEDIKTTYYNTPLTNFGCATTNSMQQQVAYPSSLIEGKTLSYPGGSGPTASPAAAGGGGGGGAGAAAASGG